MFLRVHLSCQCSSAWRPLIFQRSMIPRKNCVTSATHIPPVRHFPPTQTLLFLLILRFFDIITFIQEQQYHLSIITNDKILLGCIVESSSNTAEIMLKVLLLVVLLLVLLASTSTTTITTTISMCQQEYHGALSLLPK